MSKLRAPGLGPIVGHTTHSSCRIWVRADPETDDDGHPDSQQRSLAVIGIFREGGSSAGRSKCYYFRLHREFDRSGSINLGVDTPAPDRPAGLKSDTDYEVRVGILVLDDPTDDDEEFDSGSLLDRLPPAKVWYEDLKSLPDKACEARFRTFPANPEQAGRFSFLLGSCRFPGLLWKVRHSDRIFGPMAQQAQGVAGDLPRFQLMVGDQIYADMLNRFVPIGRADTYAEFRERYVTAYGSPNIRRLMRTLPTYMILDDHEIEDNWSQDRLKRSASYQLFTIAIDAYLSYQWSHGPRTHGKRLYYDFDYGGYPFFVLDTRTQRFIQGPKGDLAHNHMLGRPTLPGAPPGQLQRLTDWLARQQREKGNIPKFIVTSSVFVPSPMSARELPGNEVEREESDTWPGFPNTKAAILRSIVEHEVQNVVFLSGDIHCSNVARLSFSGDPKAEAITAYSVTSSAFYWPFPFADGEPSDYVHDSSDPAQRDTFTFDLSGGASVEMNYKAWNFTQEDNFCRLTLDPDTPALEVQAFDRRGDLVREETADGGESELKTVLPLVAWPASGDR